MDLILRIVVVESLGSPTRVDTSNYTEKKCSLLKNFEGLHLSEDFFSGLFFWEALFLPLSMGKSCKSPSNSDNFHLILIFLLYSRLWLENVTESGERLESIIRDE
jgi:hypothetical protein